MSFAVRRSARSQRRRGRHADAPWAIAILLATAVAGLACSKEKKQEPIVVGARPNALVAPVPAAPPQDDPEATARPADQQPVEPSAALSELLDAAAPTVMVTRTVGGSAGTLAAPPDPDLAVVAAGRAQAAGCFSRLPPHDIGTAPESRSASITVTVVPTGRVTRTDVRASGARGGAAEPELSECLKRVGDGLTFPPKEPPKAALTAGGARNGTSALGGDLRSFTIDVTVSSKH